MNSTNKFFYQNQPKIFSYNFLNENYNSKSNNNLSFPLQIRNKNYLSESNLQNNFKNQENYLNDKIHSLNENIIENDEEYHVIRNNIKILQQKINNLGNLNDTNKLNHPNLQPNNFMYENINIFKNKNNSDQYYMNQNQEIKKDNIENYFYNPIIRNSKIGNQNINLKDSINELSRNESINLSILADEFVKAFELDKNKNLNENYIKEKNIDFIQIQTQLNQIKENLENFQIEDIKEDKKEKIQNYKSISSKKDNLINYNNNDIIKNHYNNIYNTHDNIINNNFNNNYNVNNINYNHNYNKNNYIVNNNKFTDEDIMDNNHKNKEKDKILQSSSYSNKTNSNNHNENNHNNEKLEKIKYSKNKITSIKEIKEEESDENGFEENYFIDNDLMSYNDSKLYEKYNPIHSVILEVSENKESSVIVPIEELKNSFSFYKDNYHYENKNITQGRVCENFNFEKKNDNPLDNLKISVIKSNDLQKTKNINNINNNFSDDDSDEETDMILNEIIQTAKNQDLKEREKKC